MKNTFATDRVARFVVEAFGPLIAFYVFEHVYGLVAAILSGIVSGAILVTLQIARERKISPFTAFVASSVGIFEITRSRSAFIFSRARCCSFGWRIG